MAISLPERTASSVDSLTPREIVAELNKYVIGQAKAKRAVAIALRNRVRRQRLAPEMAEEVTPKNILMIGPTGVGKTEIARRLARLAQSPFIKVEASKFTEVGYVGRDVESMVRDLVELAVDMVRAEKAEEVKDKARRAAEERLLDLLLPPTRPPMPGEEAGAGDPATRTRDRMREQLRAQSPRRARSWRSRSARRRYPSFVARQLLRGDRRQPEGHAERVPGAHEDAADEGARGARPSRRRGAGRLVDMESVSRTAVQRVEQAGIIFIDEIDKIASRDGGHGGGHGPDVSREGVQRDILPIVEGTTVNSKHGMVKTDHILFIAAGAFHVSKPSDLIPELQGRFPIRVELEPLTRDDFVRILTEPRNALVDAVHGPARHRGHRPDVHAGRRRADCGLCRARERRDREHRRAPPAHRDGAAARRALLRRAGPCKRRP